MLYVVLVFQAICCTGVPGYMLFWCSRLYVVLVFHAIICTGVPCYMLFWCFRLYVVLVFQAICCSGVPGYMLYWCEGYSDKVGSVNVSSLEQHVPYVGAGLHPVALAVDDNFIYVVKIDGRYVCRASV